MRWRFRLLLIFLFASLLPLAVLGVYLAYYNEGLAIGMIGAATLATALAAGLYISFSRPLSELERGTENIASGDLKVSSEGNLPSIFGRIAENLIKVTGKMQELVSHAKTETEVVSAEANRLEMILNSIKDGVFAIDRNKQIILFNKAASDITGLKIGEAAGKHLNEILPLQKNRHLVISEWFDECLGTDMQQKAWENVTFLTKEGEQISVDAEALYIGADPNGVRMLVTFHNRTEEQQIEDMKVDFVALAAHELRTPVTIIKGYLEILEQEVGQQLDPEHQEFIRKLELSASQLAGSINNILHVSHIEHGELNLNLETADWQEIVNTTCIELKEKAASQGKDLVINSKGEIPKVSVDRVSITEVITNLVDNAIKYSSRGQQVTVNVYGTQNTVVTEVIDQGVGIPQNAIDKLFTKFYRSHRTKTSHRGTGLGLYMSKAIIEAHSGHIWVESVEGEGSTFGFELPIVAKDSSDSDNSDITRGVHGWIKNHSLYRG